MKKYNYQNDMEYHWFDIDGFSFNLFQVVLVLFIETGHNNILLPNRILYGNVRNRRDIFENSGKS